MIQAVNGKLLRPRGALGPLHCEALTGTLSVQLTPVARGEGTGTMVGVTDVVGGHARFAMRDGAVPHWAPGRSHCPLDPSDGWGGAVKQPAGAPLRVGLAGSTGSLHRGDIHGRNGTWQAAMVVASSPDRRSASA